MPQTHKHCRSCYLHKYYRSAYGVFHTFQAWWTVRQCLSITSTSRQCSVARLLYLITLLTPATPTWVPHLPGHPVVLLVPLHLVILGHHWHLACLRHWKRSRQNNGSRNKSQFTSQVWGKANRDCWSLCTWCSWGTIGTWLACSLDETAGSEVRVGQQRLLGGGGG